jgi:hypothetical protein
MPGFWKRCQLRNDLSQQHVLAVDMLLRPRLDIIQMSFKPLLYLKDIIKISLKILLNPEDII